MKSAPEDSEESMKVVRWFSPANRTASGDPGCTDKRGPSDKVFLEVVFEGKERRFI